MTVILLIFDDYPCVIESLRFDNVDVAKEFVQNRSDIFKENWRETTVSNHPMHYNSAYEIHVFE